MLRLRAPGMRTHRGNTMSKRSRAVQARAVFGQLALTMTEGMTIPMAKSAADLLIMARQHQAASSTLMQTPSGAAQMLLAAGLPLQAANSAPVAPPSTLQLGMRLSRTINHHLSQQVGLLIPAWSLELQRGYLRTTKLQQMQPLLLAPFLLQRTSR